MARGVNAREMILRRWVWCGASWFSRTTFPRSSDSGSASSRYRGKAVFALLENTSLRRDTSLTSLCFVTTQ